MLCNSKCEQWRNLGTTNLYRVVVTTEVWLSRCNPRAAMATFVQGLRVGAGMARAMYMCKSVPVGRGFTSWSTMCYLPQTARPCETGSSEAVIICLTGFLWFNVWQGIGSTIGTISAPNFGGQPITQGPRVLPCIQHSDPASVRAAVLVVTVIL